MPPKFVDFELRLVEPGFGDKLTDLVMELQYLKRHTLMGTTPPSVFFQLKEIFHLLESLASARIEGNRTTIIELIESQIEPPSEKKENIQEIENMGRAMSFMEDAVQESGGISRSLILELHKKTVRDLSLEGDPTPGYYRQGEARITGSNHKPPDHMQVENYMDELLSFFNKDDDPKYDLLKIALAHHRFAWIHPFTNGNGRVVRLLTYAMLIERGFDVRQGRLLNPSAVFCSDREVYYDMLSRADMGDDKNLLTWCEYVLQGLLDELMKIDKLLNYDFLSKRILKPSIKFAIDRKAITERDAAVLNLAVRKTPFKSTDLKSLFPDKGSVERSRIIARLKQNKLIMPIHDNARSYVLRFSNNYLLHGIMDTLENENFIEGDEKFNPRLTRLGTFSRCRFS